MFEKMDRYVQNVNDATRIVLDQRSYPTGTTCAGYTNQRRLDQPLQTSAFKSPNYVAGADDSGFSEPSIYTYTDVDENDPFPLRAHPCATSGTGSACSTPNREATDTQILPPFEIPDSSPIPTTPFLNVPSSPAFPVSLAYNQSRWPSNDVTRYAGTPTNTSPPILRIFGLFGKYMPVQDSNNNNTVSKIMTNASFGSTSVPDLSLNKLKLVPKTVTFPKTDTTSPTTGAIASILNRAPLNATGRPTWDIHSKITPQRTYHIDTNRTQSSSYVEQENIPSKFHVVQSRPVIKVIHQKSEPDAMRNLDSVKEPLLNVKRKLYTDTQVFSDISDTEYPTSDDQSHALEMTKPPAPILREFSDVSTSGGDVSGPSDDSLGDSPRPVVRATIQQSTDFSLVTVGNTCSATEMDNHRVSLQNTNNFGRIPKIKSDVCLFPRRIEPILPSRSIENKIKLHSAETEKRRLLPQCTNIAEPRKLDSNVACVKTEKCLSHSFASENLLPAGKIQKKSRDRKCSMPMRGATRFDPKFRGATIWIQTDIRKGVSRLHISAFYNNVTVRRRRRERRNAFKHCLTPAYSFSETDNVTTTPRDFHVTVKTCASCKTRRTPLWRDSEDGTPLCNACGIRYKKYRLRCSRCWHIPKKDVKTYPHCPVCASLLRYSFHKKTQAW